MNQCYLIWSLTSSSGKKKGHICIFVITLSSRLEKYVSCLPIYHMLKGIICLEDQKYRVYWNFLMIINKYHFKEEKVNLDLKKIFTKWDWDILPHNFINLYRIKRTQKCSNIFLMNGVVICV